MGQTTSVPAEPVRPSHPYYPEGVKIAGYAANNQTVPFLLSTFAGGCTVILAFAYTLLRRQNPSLSNGELATALWFVICKIINGRIKECVGPCADCLMTCKADSSMSFLKVRLSLLQQGAAHASHPQGYEYANVWCRLLHSKFWAHGRHARCLRSAMERVCTI